MCLADNAPTVTLDTNEAVFDVLAAINSCGYDSELSISHRLRQQIREEVTKAVEASPEATTSQQVLCGFFNQHQQTDESKKLSQYVSLALYLNPPPELTLKTTEAEAPPDAVAVIGIVPLLQKFQKDAGLHAGNLVKGAVTAQGGRGGGSPVLGQGSVPGREALEQIRAALL